MRTTKTTTIATTITAAALAAVILTPAHAGAAAPPTLRGCGPGELCLWQKAGFKGARHTYELSDIDIESCTALPEGGSAESLANRTGRPVTVYQSGECAETGEFNTYPGSGTWAPESPYRVRAFKVWES
ncbi:peptidase inhibitor family I36 protein [Streptomyces sp. KL118A]|uniref:peptidase inhibitor family I36 protein n=1 Tax=Streptomyces sp. KL118A TaxID=3045153 RepID=UPI00278BF7B2|nr:peptidase inhibitor family I36 protein [Streptomyces sp. KL118A]